MRDIRLARYAGLTRVCVRTELVGLGDLLDLIVLNVGLQRFRLGAGGLCYVEAMYREVWLKGRQRNP